jgi:uncharacterized protein
LLTFKQLSAWQRTAFCAALLERMLPNYHMFSQAVDFGDHDLLRNQLDLVWQKLADRNIKINSEAQLIKLELQIPDPQQFNFFGVFPAIDTCMALMSVLQGSQESDLDDVEQVSRLSQNSVSGYVELLLAQELVHQEEDSVSAQDIFQHPLMQWENASQQEYFDFLLASKENKQTCQLLKALALEQGLSNLGIEIA